MSKGISMKVFIILVLIALLSVLFLTVAPFIYEVKGAGVAETTFTTAYNSNEILKANCGSAPTDYSWLQLIQGNGMSADTGKVGVYWYADSSTGFWNQMQRSFVSWDTSSIPDDVEITGAYISIYGQTKIMSYSAVTKPNICIYETVGITDPSNLTYNDYQHVNALNDYKVNRLSDVLSYDEFLEGAANVLTLNQQGIDEISKTGWTTFAFRMTYDAEYVIPHWSSGESVTMFAYGSVSTAAQRPKLVVEYAEDVVEREIECETNDDVGAGSPALINDVVWGSPRCAYADEYMCFVVSGDVNTPVELELQDEDGNCLESIEDVIREDGDYSWYVSTSNYAGFLRCVEVSQDVQSMWGYLYESPAANGDFEYNHTYAKYTSYPQNDVEFSEYVVTEQDLMFYHWKTNVQGDELGDYSIRVWHEGDSGSEVYNKTLQWLADYYYDIEEPDNDVLMAWRYAIFVMDAGELDLKDDLIIDLDTAYGSETKGMYECVVYEDGVGKFSIPVSCYWYLTEGDLTFELDKSDYSPSEAMVGTVTSCSEVRAIFDSVRCDLVDAEGNIKTTYEKDLDGDTVVFDMQAPGTAGDYIARFTLYTESFDFEYMHDVSFTVGGGSGEGGGGLPDDWSYSGIWEWLQTSGGHLMLLILAIALEAILFWKHRAVVVIVAMALVALWIVIGWLDLWLVVLLALGAGLTIWQTLRRRASGGDKE